MRDARAADHWRRALNRQYQLFLKRIEFEALGVFGAGAIDFNAYGITAVIGGNGVGKSTLIAAVGALLTDFNGYVEGDYIGRLDGAKIIGSFKTSADDAVITVTISEERTIERISSPVADSIFWIAPSNYASSMRALIADDANFGDLIESVTPIELGEDERLELSSIVGKTYDKCLFYEIADVGDLEIFPHFRVQAEGIEYGSDRMGLGELSVFLMYWCLRKLEKHSLLIVEEPETHLSPRSQRQLMNYIAKRCAEDGLAVLLTTHSPEIVEKVDQKNLILLSRAGTKVEAHRNPSRRQVMNLLGVVDKKVGILVLEDRAGQLVLLEILRYFESPLSYEFELLIAGNNSKIDLAIKHTPKSGSWFAMIGIYDGDQRSESKPKDAVWPYIHLPTSHSPEGYLFFLLGKDVKRLAELISKPEDRILGALESMKGMDEHDALVHFAHVVEVDLNVLVRAVISVGYTNLDNQAEAAAFVRELHDVVNGFHKQ